MRVVQYSSLVRVEKVPFRLVQVGRFRNLVERMDTSTVESTMRIVEWRNTSH